MAAGKATPVPGASPHAAAMAKSLRFWVYDKGADVVSDVSGLFDSKARKITLKCELKNQTKKEMHAVRGTLRFATYFGETIADIYLETTTVLPPGEVVGVNWDITPERLGPKVFERLQKVKLEQVKQTFYPRMIVFTDGSVLK